VPLKSKTQTLLTLGDYASLTDERFLNVKIVISDDVPMDGRSRIYIHGCDFYDCDLSEVRNADIRFCRFDNSLMPPMEVLDLTSFVNPSRVAPNGND